MKIRLRNALLYSAILLIILLSFFVVRNKKQDCDVDINTNLNEINSRLKHNYILFVDKNGKSHGKIVEVNGWLTLEAFIEKSMKFPISPELANAVGYFGRRELTGWWPEETLQNGERYFSGKGPVKLYYDAGDTAGIYRYYGDNIQEDILKVFLSNASLPYPFNDSCLKIGCKSEHIIRLWSNKDWYNDVDIIEIANFMTMLNITSPFAKEVFEANKMLINFVIENENVEYYFKYYKPKVTGYFLLLFYDDQGPRFLSNKSREIISSKFKQFSYELNYKPLIARWGGGKDWFYGCNIVTLKKESQNLCCNMPSRIGVLLNLV